MNHFLVTLLMKLELQRNWLGLMILFLFVVVLQVGVQLMTWLLLQLYLPELN